MTFGAYSKSRIKRMLRKWGYDLFSREVAPYGYDFLVDVRRLALAQRRPLDVFFDVGANRGQTTSRIVDAFPAAAVFAFEPDARAFGELHANVGNLGNVRAVNVALGPRSGQSDLHLYEASEVNSVLAASPYTAHANAKPVGVVSVPTTTLDAFCSENKVGHVAVLKIDTEGYELPILEGAAGLLAAGAIDFVYAEFNRVGSSSGGAGDLVPICGYLAPHGFRFIASYTDRVETQGGLFVVSNALLARA